MKNEKFIQEVARPYAGEMYQPIVATADTDELAKAGERVILHHKGCGKYRVAELIIAPIGIMYSGWVVGINPITG